MSRLLLKQLQQDKLKQESSGTVPGKDYGDLLNNHLNNNVDQGIYGNTSGNPEVIFPQTDDDTDEDLDINTNKIQGSLLGKFRNHIVSSDWTNKQQLTRWVDSAFPNIDQSTNYDPTMFQSFYSGIAQGLTTNQIPDKELRDRYRKEIGDYNPVESALETTAYAVGELMQFYGVWRMSTATSGKIAGALVAQKLISATTPVANVASKLNKVRNVPGLKGLSDATAKTLGSQQAAVDTAIAFGLETGIWKSLNHSWIDGVLYAGGYPLAFNHILIPGFKTAYKYGKNKLIGNTNKQHPNIPGTTKDGSIVSPDGKPLEINGKPLNLKSISEMMNSSEKELEKLRFAAGGDEATIAFLDKIKQLKTENKGVFNEINMLIEKVEQGVVQATNVYLKKISAIINNHDIPLPKNAKISTINGIENTTNRLNKKISKEHKARSSSVFEQSLDEFDNIINEFVNPLLMSFNKGGFQYSPETIEALHKTIINELDSAYYNGDKLIRDLFTAGGTTGSPTGQSSLISMFKTALNKKIQNKKKLGMGETRLKEWNSAVGVSANKTDAENLAILEKRWDDYFSGVKKTRGFTKEKIEQFAINEKEINYARTSLKDIVKEEKSLAFETKFKEPHYRYQKNYRERVSPKFQTAIIPEETNYFLIRTLGLTNKNLSFKKGDDVLTDINKLIQETGLNSAASKLKTDFRLLTAVKGYAQTFGLNKNDKLINVIKRTESKLMRKTTENHAKPTGKDIALPLNYREVKEFTQDLLYILEHPLVTAMSKGNKAVAELMSKKLYNNGAKTTRNTKILQAQKTLTGKHGNNGKATQGNLKEIAEEFIDNIKSRALLSHYGLDPTDLSPSNFKRLAKKEKAMQKAQEKLVDQFYKLGTPGARNTVANSMKRLQELFGELKTNSVKRMGNRLDVIDNMLQLNKGIKMISEFNSTNKLLEGKLGIETFADDLTSMIKQVKSIKKGTKLQDYQLMKAYQKFVGNYIKTSNNTHPVVQDIEEVITTLMQSTRLSANALQRTQPSLFKALQGMVEDDLPRFITKLKKRMNKPGKTNEEFASVYTPMTERVEQLLKKKTQKGKQEAEILLAQEIIRDRRLQEFLIPANSNFSNLLLVYRAMGQKELRGVLKEVMLQNQTQSQILNVINQTNKIQNPIFSNKPVPELNPELGNVYVPGFLKKHVYDYFLKGQNKIFQDSGTDYMVALNKSVSDALQFLQRLTSKGGPLDTDLNVYQTFVKDKLKALEERIGSKVIGDKSLIGFVDDAIVGLDKLETNAMRKGIEKNEDYLATKQKFLDALPKEVQEILTEFYDLTWKYAAQYNRMIDDIQTQVGKGTVFDDIGEQIPWREGMAGLQKIERRDNYFPRIFNLNNQETYTLMFSIKDKTGKLLPAQKVPIRYLDKSSEVHSLENLHYSMSLHVEKIKLKKGEDIVYTFRPNGRPIDRVDATGQPEVSSRLRLLLDDTDQLTAMNHSQVKKLLNEGNFDFKTFYHNAFVAGPSMAKPRLGLRPDYEQNHVTALGIYMNRLARHIAMIKPTAESDSVIAHLRKQPELAKDGIQDASAYINTVTTQIDDALGRPSPTTKMLNKAINDLVTRSRKTLGINEIKEPLDFRKIVNINNTMNYYTQFGINPMAALIQTSMAVTSVGPAAGGKYLMNHFTKHNGQNFRRDVGDYITMKNPAAQTGELKAITAQKQKRFDSFPKKYRDEIEDMAQLYEENNLNLDSGHALLLADTHVSAVGREAKSWLGKKGEQYAAIGDWATTLFRQGDIIPRKLALRIAYLSSDEVFTNVITKLNKLNLNWQKETYNSTKIISMIKQERGMSQLNPLEESAMELIVNSAARKYTKSGRGKYFTKTGKGNTYTYQVNRDFKKDLATRFQEKTNHLYNSANNTGFMNNQTLKAYNLYKKFAVKEFERMTGLVQKGQYEAALGSIAGYGAIAGGLGVPFARDILNFYSWLYKTSMIEGGIVPDLGSGLPSPELLDPEYALRSSGDSWFEKLALTGVASIAGLDLSQAGAVNMSSHFDPRGTGFLKPTSGAADLAMNVVMGDTYIKISKLLRALNWGGTSADSQQIISNAGDKKYVDGEHDYLLRVLESASSFFPGVDRMMKLFTVPAGIAPLDYRGRPSNVYNEVFKSGETDSYMDLLPAGIFKALGGKSVDESMYEMSKSGRRRSELTESVAGRQQRAMKDMVRLQLKIQRAQAIGDKDTVQGLMVDIKHIAQEYEITNKMLENFIIKHGVGKVTKTPRNAAERLMLQQDLDTATIDPNTGKYVPMRDR